MGCASCGKKTWYRVTFSSGSTKDYRSLSEANAAKASDSGATVSVVTK